MPAARSYYVVDTQSHASTRRHRFAPQYLSIPLKSYNTELSCPADSPTAEALQPILGAPPLEQKTHLRGQLQRLVMSADVSAKTGDRTPSRVLCAQNSSEQDQAIAKRRGTSADGQGFFTQEISSRTSSHDHRHRLSKHRGHCQPWSPLLTSRSS